MKAANFELINRNGSLVLCINSDTDEQTFGMMLQMLGQTLQSNSSKVSAVVIDFEDNDDMNDQKWDRIKAVLKKIPDVRQFFVIQVPPAVESYVRKNSNDINLVIKRDLDQVFAALGGNGPAHADTDEALKKDLIEAFTKGALKTLEIQCSVDAKAGEFFTKNPKNRVIYDIAASMGLMSKTVSGSVALGFSEKAFLGTMSKMLGEPYEEITSDVEDGCGELLNIIFGQAKRVLNEKGYRFGKTLPTIFIGHALRVRHLTPNPAILIPFESNVGPFHLEIGYRRVSTSEER